MKADTASTTPASSPRRSPTPRMPRSRRESAAGISADVAHRLHSMEHRAEGSRPYTSLGCHSRCASSTATTRTASDIPFVDHEAVRQTVRFHRARRKARTEHRKRGRRAAIRFWLVLARPARRDRGVVGHDLARDPTALRPLSRSGRRSVSSGLAVGVDRARRHAGLRRRRVPRARARLVRPPRARARRLPARSLRADAAAAAPARAARASTRSSRAARESPCSSARPCRTARRPSTPASCATCRTSAISSAPRSARSSRSLLALLVAGVALHRSTAVANRRAAGACCVGSLVTLGIAVLLRAVHPARLRRLPPALPRDLLQRQQLALLETDTLLRLYPEVFWQDTATLAAVIVVAQAIVVGARRRLVAAPPPEAVGRRPDPAAAS